jgi:hypothetical protein
MDRLPAGKPVLGPWAPGGGGPYSFRRGSLRDSSTAYGPYGNRSRSMKRISSSDMGSVLAGGLLALFGVIVGKFWDERSDRRRWTREADEHTKRWLRERRVDSYARFLAAALELYVLRAVKPVDTMSLEQVSTMEAHRLALDDAMAHVEIHGGKPAVDIAKQLFLHATNPPERMLTSVEWTAMSQRVVAVFRSDLDL